MYNRYNIVWYTGAKIMYIYDPRCREVTQKGNTAYPDYTHEYIALAPVLSLLTPVRTHEGIGGTRSFTEYELTPEEYEAITGEKP